MGVCIAKGQNFIPFLKINLNNFASYDESPRSAGRHLGESWFFFTTIHMYWNDLVLSKRAPMDLEISTAYLQIQVAGS